MENSVQLSRCPVVQVPTSLVPSCPVAHMVLVPTSPGAHMSFVARCLHISTTCPGGHMSLVSRWFWCKVVQVPIGRMSPLPRYPHVPSTQLSMCSLL